MPEARQQYAVLLAALAAEAKRYNVEKQDLAWLRQCIGADAVAFADGYLQS